MNPLPSTEPPTATGGNLQTTVYRSLKSSIFLLVVVVLGENYLTKIAKFTRFFLHNTINAYQILIQKQ